MPIATRRHESGMVREALCARYPLYSSELPTSHLFRCERYRIAYVFIELALALALLAMMATLFKGCVL